MALMWAFLYMILDLVSPGSFSFPETGFRGETMQFEYLSFVTITTLGYGDITPINAIAQSWTVLEAIIGQIYLVVVISGLVGIFISHTRHYKSD